MESIRLMKVAVSAVAMILAGFTAVPANADTIIPTAQTREVYVYAHADDPFYTGSSETVEDMDEAIDYTPFDSSVSADVDLYYALTYAGAQQQSTIGSCRLTALGSIDTSLDSLGDYTYCAAYGYSYHRIEFDLTETVELRFSGSVYSSYYAGCTVSLGESGVGSIWSYGSSGWDGDFDHSIILAPGSYWTDANAQGVITTDDSIYCEALADYDLTIDVCPFVAGLTCEPGSGTLPFPSNFIVTIDNREATRPTSRVAAKIDVTLASSGFFSNWKAGFTQIPGGGNFTTSWIQPFPLLGTLVGDNVFVIQVEDVTPAPYNQPPYNPSGFTCSDSCTVTCMVP